MGNSNQTVTMPKDFSFLDDMDNAPIADTIASLEEEIFDLYGELLKKEEALEILTSNIEQDLMV